MSSKVAASRTGSGMTHAGLDIDVRWVMRELLDEGHVSREDFNVISTTPREKQELDWHPLQVVAKYRLQDARDESDALLDVDWLSRWLAGKAELPLYHIDPMKADVNQITTLMSYAFAERHGILAVEVSRDSVTVVCDQPFRRGWEEHLAHVLRERALTVALGNPEQIRRFRMEFYNLSRSMAGARDRGGQSLSHVTNFEQLLEVGQGTPDADDKHVANIVDWILQYAFSQRASDIHLEPRRETGRMRFRIDGVLHDVYEMPASILAAVTSRLKILTRLNVAEKRKPQDGRLKTKTPDGDEVELRISTLPTAFGEKMVMRIFDPDVLVRTFDQLGFSKEDYAAWQQMTRSNNGIVFVTGPTGSGKTTTLYSTLKQLSTPEVNVCTIEDPIEMVEPSFNQMQVQTSIEVGFAQGVKALLRQDPDIIMIGEIRDLPTADMAIQAALTGHLVLSTLHTNDAPSSVTRLVDLGVPPYLITATVEGVMAQRLVRTLCPHCKAAVPTEPAAWDELIRPFRLKMPEQVFRPVGCLECRGTGYLGRMGVYELLPMTSALKGVISRGGDLEAITRAALKEGMKPLRISGAQKVARGLTTIEEVLRVTPQQDVLLG